MRVKSIHLNAKAMQRSKGKSATAAAAYRSGEEITDQRTGAVHDYTRKSGVGENWIVGFSGSRSELWNLAELSEKRKDSTTAKEFDVALPIELSPDDRVELARKYSKWLHKQHGCAVDVCIHNLYSDNPHAHIMFSTRAIEPDGSMSDEKIAREWSDTKRKKHNLPGRKKELLNERVHFADVCNYMLRQAGVTGVKYDHRSYKERGSRKKPTKHHGGHETLHSKLIREYNEAVMAFNRTIDEIEVLQHEIENQPPEPITDPEPDQKPVISPKIADVLDEMKSNIDEVKVAAESSNLIDDPSIFDFSRIKDHARKLADRIMGRSENSPPSKSRGREL